MSGGGITLGDFIAQRGRRVSLRNGESLFREGDVSTCVYACVSGRINVFVTTPTGRDVILGFKVPTQAFGELSAIDGGVRSASAVAVGPSSVVQMSGDEFLDQLEQVPHLSMMVLRELSDHLRRINGRLSAGSSESATERVAHLLVELAAKFRRHGSVSTRIELPVTQDELAAWVGTTREATARSLAVLRRSGAIETGRNMVVVIDPKLLLRSI